MLNYSIEIGGKLSKAQAECLLKKVKKLDLRLHPDCQNPLFLCPDSLDDLLNGLTEGVLILINDNNEGAEGGDLEIIENYLMLEKIPFVRYQDDPNGYGPYRTIFDPNNPQCGPWGYDESLWFEKPLISVPYKEDLLRVINLLEDGKINEAKNLLKDELFGPEIFKGLPPFEIV